MKLDWKTRINAVDALNHPYFKMAPFPLEPHEIPQFEESHELDRRKFHDRKAALPPAPKGGTVGLGPDANGATAGFNSNDPYGNVRNGANGGRYRNGPGPEERRPAWQRDRGGPPPRPPPPAEDPDYRGPPRSRGGPRGGGGGGGGGDVDTYIPAYGRDDGVRRRDDRPPRDDRRRRDSRDERRYDRDRTTRSRSRSPRHERSRDRERNDRDVYRR